MAIYNNNALYNLLCTDDFWSHEKLTSHDTFCVSRNTSITDHQGKIFFTNSLLNDSANFDFHNSQFTPKYSGLYWFHWSVSLQSTSFIDVSLVGGPRKPDIIKYASSTLTDITSRDEIAILQANQTNIFLSSDFNPILLYSSDGQELSFSGFHIHSTMKPIVAFSFGRSAITSSYGKIPFDIIIVDTHNSWNVLTNSYVIPRNGTYVITLMIATNAIGGSLYYYRARIGLYVDLNLITGIHCADRCRPTSGEVTISKTVIIKCKKKSQLHATLENNGPIYSDLRYHTALLGFMYSPRDGIPIAWSVALSSTHNIGSELLVYFDHIFVNEGNGWISSNSSFVVPESGVYYVHLSASLLMKNGYSSDQTDSFQLLLNSSPLISQSVYSSSNDYYQSTLAVNSRAIIVRLFVGDLLQVRLCCSGSRFLYSNSYKLSTFSGFRIHF